MTGQPVALTEEQINEILSAVPRPPGIGETALKQAQENIRSILRMALHDVKLVPDSQAYQEFKDQVIESLYQSFVDLHKPVGMNAAIAISSPMTQMTLNTQRSAGTQSGMTNAFTKIRNLILSSKSGNKSVDIRSLEMKILLKEPTECDNMHEVLHSGTRESIFDLRPEFEQTTVERLITKSEIMNNKQFDEGYMKKLFELHKILYPQKFAKNVLPSYSYVLVLKLDHYRMFSHKITMQKIAQSIEGSNYVFVCLWESNFSNTMYILINSLMGIENNIFDTETAYPTFFNVEIIDRCKDWVVSGIAGIEFIEPYRVDVLSVVESITDHPRGVKLEFSHKSTRFVGASVADVKRLIEACGYFVLEHGHEPNPYLIVANTTTSIIKDIRSKVIALGKKKDLSDTEKNIQKYCQFFYIRTVGLNMEQVIWRDDVDVFRSYPNNANMIASMLGIDAADRFLNVEFVHVVERVDSKLYTDPRHIELMFKMKTNLGISASLGHSGLNRRGMGATSAASQERATDFFTASSVFGTEEKLKSISASIYVGAVNKHLGTGAVKMQIDPEYAKTCLPSDITDYNDANDDILDEQGYEENKFEDLFDLYGNSQLATIQSGTVEKKSEFGLRMLEVGKDEKKNIDLSMLKFEVDTTVPTINEVQKEGISAGKNVIEMDSVYQHLEDAGNLSMQELDELFGVEEKSEVKKVSEVKSIVSPPSVELESQSYSVVLSTSCAGYLNANNISTDSVINYYSSQKYINKVVNFDDSVYKKLIDSEFVQQLFILPFQDGLYQKGIKSYVYHGIGVGGDLIDINKLTDYKSRSLIMPVYEADAVAKKVDIVAKMKYCLVIYTDTEASSFSSLWDATATENRMKFEPGEAKMINAQGERKPIDHSLYLVNKGISKVVIGKLFKFMKDSMK
jgi:hypothetical protein